MSQRMDNAYQAGDGVTDYRHRNVKRLNIPPAGIAARGQIVKERKLRYAYNPHLTPTLRFDATGQADYVLKLIEKAGQQKLEPEEVGILEEAFRNHEPWLEWAGKREQQWCVADPVALHIHERISTQAILRVARRQDVQRSLFADPEQEYREAVQFYKHPMDWTNRMILGDSLAVMASLARREGLAGKVQMIYMDPPYGIKYASNFQAEVGRRDVKDRDEDLTREPEMVKAYRDTWTLGVHSYLSYLRDRLLLCKELLADTGSVFVQISDENLHRVRALMDEVFGATNFIATICFKKSGARSGDWIDTTNDFLLWYAKNREKTKYKRVFRYRTDGEMAPNYRLMELASGEHEPADFDTKDPKRYFIDDQLLSPGASLVGTFDFLFQGHRHNPGDSYHWKTNEMGLNRLAQSYRLIRVGTWLKYKRFLEDYPVMPIADVWFDTVVSTFSEVDKKVYAVQTASKVIERCLQMTTDPGDLVLDPTCGSGTTAYVAEQWGRRWITIDVSRVSLAIARQRLLTAKYDYYRLRPTSAEDARRNPDGPWLTDPAEQIPGPCTFDCKTVTHITLKSIAQNQALDPIFEKWAPALADRLAALNRALQQDVTKEIRFQLLAKLEGKRKREGKKSITDADTRRWKLPETEWKEWGVPFDADPDWPGALRNALADYRKAWRQKMDEVNACIAARADQEELVDQPFTEKGKIRVSGPFTMEGVIPAEESIDAGDDIHPLLTSPIEGEGKGKSPIEGEGKGESPIGGAPEGLETFGEGEGSIRTEPQNAEAYLDRMIRLLRQDGVRFPDNRVMKFAALEALADGSMLHAKGVWANGNGERQVAVMFGPQYGPLTARMVEEGIRVAARRGYDDLVFAAFSFDGEAQVTIQEVQDPHLKLHMAQIRPDVNMGDLLKTTVSSQLFTVSGSPRTRLEQNEDGQYVVHMEGVDIYDPVTNSIRSTGAAKVAAWFLDSDYDGRCFCVCQAFFPDKNAWEKLGKALGGAVDDDAFARLSGTVSLPFAGGPHQRIAVKVIDPRGNEVLRVLRLDEKYTTREHP